MFNFFGLPFSMFFPFINNCMFFFRSLTTMYVHLLYCKDEGDNE